jgi:hypothetical protein
MPDRHGPLRVVYQERRQGEEIPSTVWSTFEDETPNDILDRITRGILQTDPQWLGEVDLTSDEIAAVEEAFGVTIEVPEDGGEPEPPAPATRFSVERFDGSADPAEGGGITNLFYKVKIDDADGDDDVTGFRLEASKDGFVIDSLEYLPDGPDTGADERTNFEAGLFTEQAVERPFTVTLSAADEDSAGSFVELDSDFYAPV